MLTLVSPSIVAMVFRSFTVTLAAVMALAACSSPAEPPPSSVEPAGPGTSAPTSVPAETPEPTGPSGITGEQLQATYDAAVASQPGHPLIRRGSFQYGYLDFTYSPIQWMAARLLSRPASGANHR